MKPRTDDNPGRLRRLASATREGVASMVVDLTGGHLLLALASAVLLTVIHPIPGWDLLAWIAAVPLLLAIERVPARSSFTLAFITFFVSRTATLYWLVYTMNHYGFIALPLSVLILVILTATIGTLWGFGFYGLVRFTRGLRLPVVLALPMVWVADEWLQSWLLSGFPWSPLGNAPIHRLLIVQSADLFGVWGLSFLVALVNAAIYEVCRFGLKRREGFPVAAVAVAAALFAANLVYGHFRLAQVEAHMAQADPFRVAVLQGNIDQLEKWRNKRVRRETPIMYRDMAATANANGDVALVILPETALPVWQRRDRPLDRRISRFGPASGTFVLLGCPTKGWDEDDYRINYNSAVLVSPEGVAKGWYHKNRLVPFSEHIPYNRELVKLLGDWIEGSAGNFEPWGRYSKMEIPEGPFAVVICFEVIFPDVVRTIANQGAVFLPNITNDAWFGDTSAPHQHFAMVTMRAIENRLYIPRAANTGISGIVEPTGRVVHRTDLYLRDSYVGEVRPMTIGSLYRRVGDLLGWVCGLGFVTLALIVRLRRRRGA